MYSARGSQFFSLSSWDFRILSRSRSDSGKSNRYETYADGAFSPLSLVGLRLFEAPY